MKLARLAIPLAAVGCFAVTAGARAAETRDGDMWTMQPAFFVGAGGGYNWLHGGSVPNQTGDLDDSNFSFKVPFGWAYNQMLAFEGQYINFGTSDDGNNRIEADGWTADIVGGYPVTPHLVPYAKVGALFWNSDRRFPTGSPGVQEERDGNGTDLTWGLGVRMPFTEHIALKVEYERFRFGDIERDPGAGGGAFDHVDGARANMASASVLFSF